MKEQPLFAPGDRVVCVDSKGTDCLIEGKQYKINSILRCSGCGKIEVNVGTNNGKGTRCTCGVRVSKGYELWYFQTRFVPVDFSEYADEVLHESLKGKKVNI